MGTSTDISVVLDSAKDSKTVAECRHMARLLLPEVLDALGDIALNPTNKNSDRISAADILRKFAEGSVDEEKSIVPKLSAAVARKIAKLGKRFEQTQGRGETGALVSSSEGGERVGGGPADDTGDGDVPG